MSFVSFHSPGALPAGPVHPQAIQVPPPHFTMKKVNFYYGDPCINTNPHLQLQLSTHGNFVSLTLLPSTSFPSSYF